MAFSISLASSSVFVACGDDESVVAPPEPFDGGNTGGVGQSGGGPSTGGRPNTGGIGSGGRPNTGGTPTTGGATATGGVPTDAPTSNGDAADGLSPDSAD